MSPHENILKYYECYEWSFTDVSDNKYNCLYISMDLCETDLEKLIVEYKKEDKFFSERDCFHILN